MKKLLLMLSLIAFVSIATVSCKQQAKEPANEEESVIQTEESEGAKEAPVVDEKQAPAPAVDESGNLVKNAEDGVAAAEKALEDAKASGNKEAEDAANKTLEEAKANLELVKKNASSTEKGDMKEKDESLQQLSGEAD